MAEHTRGNRGAEDNRVTTSKIPTGGPSRDALMFLFGALVIVGGFAVALYAITDREHRPEMLRWLAQGFPTLVFGAPALLAWLSGAQAAARSSEVNAKMDHMTDKVNGHLTDLTAKIPDADHR